MAWPFLLRTVTYKSVLPAGRGAPACLPQLVTLSRWQSAPAGSPFPWARQGHSCPKWAVWQQTRMRGCLGICPFPFTHSLAQQKRFFPLDKLKQQVPGHIHHVGRDGSSSLAKLTLA